MREDFNVTIDQSQSMNVQFKEDVFDCVFDDVRSADYSGPYQVTPSETEQVLPTANTSLASNIVINPIPSNYGLVEWNGSNLTIS